MEYKLYETETGIEHELEFENIADIQCCLHVVYALKQLRKGPKTPEDKKRFEYDVKNIPGINCLPETIQKMSKVTVPVTEY